MQEWRDKNEWVRYSRVRILEDAAALILPRIHSADMGKRTQSHFNYAKSICTAALPKTPILRRHSGPFILPLRSSSYVPRFTSHRVHPRGRAYLLNRLYRRSTDEQSLAPRTHVTVAACLSSASGMRHFTSSRLGHGQSEGLETQTSVSGHKYCAQGTKTADQLLVSFARSRPHSPASAWAAHCEWEDGLRC